MSGDQGGGCGDGGVPSAGAGATRRQVLAGLALAPWLASRAASARAAATPEDTPLSDERLRWFLDAGLGLFLHWGPYSVAGVEASWPIMVPSLVRPLGPHQEISEDAYVALARRFDPVEFDAGEWVRTARRAGMRYVVLTAKHHDGFCMFDAPGTSYKITETPFGRDVVAELAAACRADGLRFGFYYSPPDMHHPGYRDTRRPVRENWFGEPGRPQWSEYLDTMEAHLRHLLTAYGPIAIVWFDGLFAHDKYDPARFHHLVRELAPRALVNDRLGPDLGDYATPEQNVPDGIPVRRSEPAPEVSLEQFQTFLRALEGGMSPEEMEAVFTAAQRARFPTETLPDPSDFRPWETCLTIGSTWAWDPHETGYKPVAQLIRILVEVASRGGNLLLNVGPTPRGTFPEPCRERLAGIGAWLEEHGEAIHGTRYGPLQGVAGVRTTAAADRVYLHLLDWPGGELGLADLPGQVARASLLGDSAAELPVRTGDERRSVVLPSVASDGPVRVARLELLRGDAR